ncbi:MAG: tetratricopeptide repeat protein [candidate division WOR-3 bacterium]
MIIFYLGAKYYFMREYVTSIIYTDMSIKLKPNFSRAYNLRAIVLRELKRYSKALEYIDKAIELEPNVIFFLE